MIHEFEALLRQAAANQQQGVKSVLATLVALDGSSYRRPGVRMLISEGGQATGAVSGGCVEPTVARRAEAVFASGQAEVMTYDGRYRLGCKGTLFLLLEPFEPAPVLYEAFRQSQAQRQAIQLDAWFRPAEGAKGSFGTWITLADGGRYAASPQVATEPEVGWELFSQRLAPPFRLWLVGTGHDATKLCAQGAALGWEVTVLGSLKRPPKPADFPGAAQVMPAEAALLPALKPGADTAVVLMTHNFSLDLQYLLALQACTPAYLGVIGAAARREELLDQLLERMPEVDPDFLDRIHSPAGLDLGAETPEEIALSILAEILAVTRQREGGSLKAAKGALHGG